MKNWLYPTLMSLLPLTASAQSSVGQMDMQKMMQQAGKMEACMKNLDQTALDRLGQEVEVFEGKIKQLCQADQRDQAQALAIRFAQRMAADPEVQKIRECSRRMAGMFPPMNIPTPEDTQRRHICDEQ